MEEILKQCQETLNTDMGKMKKYKLIKPYPNSLEVGTEVVWGNHGLNGECYETRVKSGIFRFSKETIENNPEFWQKVEQLDYQILTFSTVKGFLYKKQLSGIYGKEGFTLTDCITNPRYSIHSVKRLSDGLILTVGDTVVTKNTLTSKVITGFEVKDGETSYKKGIWVKYKNGKVHLGCVTDICHPILITEDGVPVYSYDSAQYWVIDNKYTTSLYLCRRYVDLLRDEPETYKVFSTEKAAKDYVSKIPVVTTEDGVKILEGNICYRVTTDFEISLVKVTRESICLESKYFSTQKAAQKYIDSSPRLSLIDCLNIKKEWYNNNLDLEETIREYLKNNDK